MQSCQTSLRLGSEFPGNFRDLRLRVLDLTEAWGGLRFEGRKVRPHTNIRTHIATSHSRFAFGQGLWGGRLPDDWQVIDAEMYAVLAYLRKMATAEDAADRRCLVLSDCKPALQQIEAAHRKGSLEGLREWDRGVTGPVGARTARRGAHGGVAHGRGDGAAGWNTPS